MGPAESSNALVEANEMQDSDSLIDWEGFVSSDGHNVMGSHLPSVNLFIVWIHTTHAHCTHKNEYIGLQFLDIIRMLPSHIYITDL